MSSERNNVMRNVSSVKRHLFAKEISLPPYYLSVVARNLTQRKAQWAKERENGMPRPETKSWKDPESDDPRGSLIIRVDSTGAIIASTSCGLAHGMLTIPDGILSAQHGEIRRYSVDLREYHTFASITAFNDLHTLRETPKGILVASSGTDSIFEISRDGREVVWSWWAREQGFPVDAHGINRESERSLDHRNLFYNTWQRTTHVNSALPFDDHSILATFFHQGIMCNINRTTGHVTPIISDLRRPHALRWSADNRITFADTGRGIAYRGKISENVFTEENRIAIKTNWLQDCQHVNGMWILVDAEHARVYFADLGQNVLAYDQFDPEWDFFEVSLSDT